MDPAERELGWPELDWLLDVLTPPCRLGDFVLEALIHRTSTALVFIASGGVFGSGEGIIKMAAPHHATLLARELELLNSCVSQNAHGVIRPTSPMLRKLSIAQDDRAAELACMLLPFLSGGDLVGWVGDHATRTGRLGAGVALEAGIQVAGILRGLLQMDPPLVHHDIKPQNLLLPRRGAPIEEVTLVDFDVAERLQSCVDATGSASAEPANSLFADVHGFGELLYSLATGHEVPTEGSVDPGTANAEFNAIVTRCLESQPEVSGYASMADGRLWRDLEAAQAAEHEKRFTGHLRLRLVLACLGVVLFIGLLGAIAVRVASP